VTFDEYQTKAAETAIYPGMGKEQGLAYSILGLVNEAGEVAGKRKKQIRDGSFGPSDLEVAKEVGDTLWYLAMVANDLGMDLSDIAKHNLDKLASRKERGTLQGSGDNR
jgi:NTP pyrophosphatase (non-canonical NTP hydrolase)